MPQTVREDVEFRASGCGASSYAGAMPAHQPMSFHLETERLSMRPWAESDVDDYRALVAERGEVIPAAENVRERIATSSPRQRRRGSRCSRSVCWRSSGSNVITSRLTTIEASWCG